MVYTPTKYTNFLQTIASFADGDLANATLFNASAENITDNTRFLIDSLYSNLKSNILSYIKSMGLKELTPVAPMPITFTNGSPVFDFTHGGATTINPGDFLIITNSTNNITLDYIVMVIQNNVDPIRTLYEDFAGLSGSYSSVYKFEIDSGSEGKYFSGFTTDIASIVELLANDILNGGRLSSLDENALALSVGINADGTKGNFTSTEIISHPSVSYYTALQDLDKSFTFLSNIKPDAVAKKNYVGTHARIKSTLSSFGSLLGTLSATEKSLYGVITGNELLTIPAFNYDSTDSCAITISGTTCESFKLSAELGTLIDSVVHIDVKTNLRELIIDGLSFAYRGKLYITSNSNIDRLAITNCKINPDNDMTDYWIEIDQTAGTINNTTISYCKSDMDDATSAAYELYGIKTNIAGKMIILNNTFTGKCYIEATEIIGTNNFFKCGKTTAGEDTVSFIGNLNLGFNKFIMINGYSTTHAIVNYFVSLSCTDYCIFTENMIRNESTGADTVFPSLLKTITTVNTNVNINNNILESVATNAAVFDIPCIDLGEYKTLKFADNQINIFNSLACGADDHYIYLATNAANNGGEFIRNSITVNTSSGPAGSAGVAQSLEFGDYASIILVNNPAGILKVNDNNFYFINRNKYVRLIMRTGTTGSVLYAENNRSDIKNGTDFSYIWTGVAPIPVDDDWYYPQDKKIDDGYVFCAVAPNNVDIAAQQDIDWSTYLGDIASGHECVVIDCAGYWNGAEGFEITKNGFYNINAMVTLSEVSAGARYGIEILNKSTALPAGITEMGMPGPGYVYGPVVAGNTGLFLSAETPRHVTVSASNSLPLKTTGVNNPLLEYRLRNGDIVAGEGHATFTIKRIH